MRNIRVCLCDDDNTTNMTYAGCIKGCFRQMGVGCDVDVYGSAEELRKRMSQITYDILFLDIDMPKEDGITFAAQLREEKNAATIIFVTAREDRMYDTFKVRPFGFVRKSRLVEDLTETVKQYIGANSELFAEMVIFPTRTGAFRINAKQIVYVESYQHSQYVYVNGQERFEICSRMEKVEQTLADNGFIRVHKGYIVNYRYIKRIANSELLLTTGQVLPVSRTRKKEVKELWLKFGTKNGFLYLDD